MTKPIEFIGKSLDVIRDFPSPARQMTGYQLDRIQRGLEPLDFKPMPIVGSGVYEIRIRDESGAFRVIYTAKFDSVVYVLHAFQKKTQKTSRLDIALAERRYRELVNELKGADQ